MNTSTSGMNITSSTLLNSKINWKGGEKIECGLTAENVPQEEILI